MGQHPGTAEAVSQQLPLNSWHFLLLAGVAIVACRAVPGRRARGILLTLFNLYFLSHFLVGWASIVAIGTLIAGTFLLGELRVRWGERVPEWSFTAIVIGMWVGLFLIKDPNLFAVANPFHYFPIKIVGISYLMFRAICYVNDVEILDRRDPVSFLNYMIFFPTLLVGPIERYDEFQERHDADEPPNVEVLPALHRIANGLIKKFVLADNLVAFGILGQSQADLESSTAVVLWVGVLMQLLLLYLDFSGYCDVVLGVAALVGIPVMENFNRPFVATNIQDFWNRWHISLTSFLRDYVFNPLNYLVVSRFDKRWHFALVTVVYFLVMMLIALWHATTWGLFAFGIVHGSALVLLQLYRRYTPDSFRERLIASPTAQGVSRAATYTFATMSMMLWSCGVVGSWHMLCTMVGAR